MSWDSVIKKYLTNYIQQMANYQQETSPSMSNDTATKEKIREILNRGFQFDKITVENQDVAINNLTDAVWDYFQKNSNSQLKERLEIYWTFEEHYLKVLKDYKEELKFVASMQEDLRKERAKFFGETLKVVSNTLKETQVPNEVQSKWIAELVSSYTQSLDLSDNLIQEKTAQSLESIKEEVKNEVEKNIKNTQE